MPDEIDNNQPGPDGNPPESNDPAGKDEPTPANHDADAAPQGPEAGRPLSSESSGSPDGTRLRCRYCNQLNQIRAGVVTAGSNIRCGRCRLPLSEEPHKKFTGLDPHSYIHPLDSQALKTLQMIPGIDPILKKLLEVTGESILRIMFMANGVRVTEKQCPDLNAKLEVVCSTLGVEKPELYLSVTNPLAGGGGLGFNAFTSGVERPFIVVFSPLIERLDDDEVLAVLAHEVGHIHSQHLLYKVAAQLLFLLTERAVELSPIPPGIAGLITYPIRAALFTWYQKAELSCDRAAQLVVQDVNVITRVMLKLGGGLMNSKVDHEEFIKQAREFDRMVSASFIDNFWTSLLAAERTHPFPVWRVSEILKWTEDPAGYAKVMEADQKAASATS
ncbi:MAG: M48 family metallopeptidase [Blastocatellia bacterium]|nr:M48 family metallopeptidase [Blastocatellia bacterium]